MLDDMQVISVDLKTEKHIKIYPIGDVHLGAAEHMSKEWSDFLRKIADDDSAYLILTGDLMNNATRASVSDVYEEICPPSEQKKIIYDQLYSVRDKILCGVMGNHEGRSAKDVDNDPLYDVFVQLGIQERYRKNMAFLRIRLQLATFKVVVLHGTTPNKAKNFSYAIDGVDCMITSHTHNPSVNRPAKLIFPVKGDHVSVKPYVTITVPSWLDYGGYGARHMYMPQTTGAPQYIVFSARTHCGRNVDRKKMQVVW
jgi:predicted phosphodiesterase